MARWFVMLVLTCGCRQLWGLGGTPDLAIDASDNTPDVPVDVAGDGSLCFGTFGDAPYCLDAAPTTPLAIATATTLNTQNSPMCSTLFTGECVIAATQIEIDQKLTAIGSRPLVLIATIDLRVSSSGMIDAASHHAGNRGAASDDKTCDNGHAPGDEAGAQGGSFGGSGGNGGNGIGAGGQPGATAVPTSLRGGCPGANGGSGGGTGGDGGGAIYLIAAAQIVISGSVDASGAGANPGANNVRGGGGGGSGGMIVLEAAAITIDTGNVFANGGGGGGGSSLLGDGTAGSDPTTVMAALGGRGGSGAGDGGNGSSGAMLDGSKGASSPSDGGGGAGGGAGVVKAIGGVITNISAVSPAPT